MHIHNYFLLPFWMKIIKLAVLHLGLLHPQNDSCDSALDFGLNGDIKTQRDFASFCMAQPPSQVHAYDV